MNCEIFHLRELDVEPYQIREVLRCILHTVMFNRALGLVRPHDVDSELFDLTYVQCGDLTFEKKMEEKIDQLIAWVEKHPNKKITVCLSFYETRSKQNAWFGHKMERLYWEQWYVTLNTTVQQSHLRSKPHHDKLGDALDLMTDERSKRHALLESGLKEVMLQILQQVNEKKDHVPPVTSQDVVSFPYEISIPSSSDSSFGMDMFKRMLQTGPPTMLG
ncbi:hypothetical protein SELMODRAFT_423950 [Selaginella moellendorffii]|uniref:Autophagy-related protein 101 n=1 Tax=Selaginella moellendorffii TaxID=88036 RepID=D8SNB5_SELML|nr:autophagy-related protein 101 [Selaginella moellendorffii]EFJ14139.1 hypothetical protein SELMODRAFT_423950 [Selaginella moellendorffii]|eukprot:XP_002984889.1 autophagy-related protein 101 [Selaginella moellendorffii]